MKRWLRELVRIELLPALGSVAACDVAIRSRPNAYETRLDDLRDDIRLVIRQAQGAMVP